MNCKLNILFSLIIISSCILTNCNIKPKVAIIETKADQDEQSEEYNLATKWIDFIVKNSGFIEINKQKVNSLDFGNVLSNQLRSKNDPISTYIGVFGTNFNRIDFHIEAIKKEGEYLISGKNKLNDNIRELKGEMKLKRAFLRQEDFGFTDSLYIALFDCVMREPGDKSGDGVFSGIFTVVFYIKNGESELFKTDSGDEPTYTNTFVGKWTKYNSTIQKKCIFSFHPAGLYEKLPFCDEIYTIYDGNDDYTIIKDEYVKNGWENFNYKGEKTDWWK